MAEKTGVEIELTASDKASEEIGKAGKSMGDAFNPLNAVTIWGITDYPDLAPGNYTYDLNSPFGGLVDENLDYKDAFYQVLEVLKTKE